MTEDDAQDATGRVGLVGHGVYHLLLALLCGQLIGGGGQDAGPQGAIATVARQPFGQALLGALTVAFACYATARWVRVVRGEEATDRITDALRATVWTALTLLAGRQLVGGLGGGSSGSGDAGATSLTRAVLDAPGGPWLVGAVGVVLAGVAVHQLRHATDDALGHELDELGVGGRRLARALGRVGYGGRTLAYGLVAGFVVRAAVHHDPAAGRGLDGALQQLQDTSWGPWVLLAVTVGFAAFGVFRLVEARWAGDAP